MKSMNETSRLIFLGFFLSHIPITLIMDGQASLLNLPYPQAVTDMSVWYANTLNDPNFLNGYDLWFQCYITTELYVQLPYFFIASYMLYKRSYPEWFRVMSLIYAAQSITAIIPVLAEAWFNPNATLSERIVLVSVYLPYLLVPLWFLRVLLRDDFAPTTKQRIPASTMPSGSKLAFQIFFYTHIPITMLIDSQAVLPIHPAPLRNLVHWYATTLSDHLMTPPFALWFQSLVACEMQFSFFWIAIQQLLLSSSTFAPWFPAVALVYGAHVCTTMIPIYAEFLMQDDTPWLVCAIYAPYAIFPAWLGYWAATTMMMSNTNNSSSIQKQE